MSKYQSFEKLIIHFDTGPIPPPFCYKYALEIHNDSEKYTASLQLDYYDRDEITEDEILDEGFTLNDDFSWEGELPSIWGREIQKKLAVSNFAKTSTTNEQESVFELRLIDQGKSEILYVANQKVWEVFAQEMIQAIFELGKKESPLTIQFLNITQDKEQSSFQMNFAFSNRQVTIHSNKRKSYIIDWMEGQKILQYIYFFDYLPEDVIAKSPNAPGNYLDPGDGYWYSMTIGARDNKLEDRKERLVETLKSYF